MSTKAETLAAYWPALTADERAQFLTNAATPVHTFHVEHGTVSFSVALFEEFSERITLHTAVVSGEDEETGSSYLAEETFFFHDDLPTLDGYFVNTAFYGWEG